MKSINKISYMVCIFMQIIKLLISYYTNKVQIANPVYFTEYIQFYLQPALAKKVKIST